MRVVTADMPIPTDDAPAIFLVGPTPRDEETPSWRPEAISFLKVIGFDGVVFVPERESWDCYYTDQIEWGHGGLDRAASNGCIAAWVPRDLKTMPAFTTNIEFGIYVGCGRFAYGRPPEAPKCRYLDWLYKKRTGMEPLVTLLSLMNQAVRMANES